MPQHQKPIPGDPLLGGYSMPRQPRKQRKPIEYEFPIGFKKLLLWALLEIRPENRMLICCRFVRESFLKRYRRQPTDAKINAELQSMRKKRYSLNQANSIRNDMWVIAEEIKRENLKKRAEAGALARWKKEKIGY